jgi:hypothetical protein
MAMLMLLLQLMLMLLILMLLMLMLLMLLKLISTFGVEMVIVTTFHRHRPTVHLEWLVQAEQLCQEEAEQ